MEFIHQPYVPGETIAAIATPPGEGGIAIIRISGREALTIGEKVFSGPVRSYTTHTAHLGYVKEESGVHIDQALVLVMLGKRSYTGEDTVEIHCHGGHFAAKRVLQAVLKAGARAASPGEFTFKAFINGKLDLAQAEAVQNLISAKNEKAFEAAGSQLEGRLSEKISNFQKKLIEVAAILEAWVDFPEEGLEFASIEEIDSEISKVIEDMHQLSATFEDGCKIQHGISLCIIGSPNAGKSSLMNALLDKDRAIVTPIAGTTRDLLEEDFFLNGLNLRLIDTAGIRDAEEFIEKEGIKRSLKAFQKADLTLMLLDASREMHEKEKDLLSQLSKNKTLIVWNKIDLSESYIRELDFEFVVKISAKEKLGLDVLKCAIDKLIWKKGDFFKEEVFITSSRHKEALLNSIKSLEMVKNGLKEGISPEFLTIDMRTGLLELGKIIGTNITEDILSSIFSKFCIGK